MPTMGKRSAGLSDAKNSGRGHAGQGFRSGVSAVADAPLFDAPDEAAALREKINDESGQAKFNGDARNQR